MTGPAYLFFRQMEREAKLAGRLDDQSEQSVLVQAVCKGIPWSYSQIIANIRFSIPKTYPEWKRHIITMYEECTKDYVYAKTHGLEQRFDNRKPPPKTFNTATSSRPAAGGATSSSANKSTDKPRDARGQWYTPKGKDTDMQINRSKLMSEGRCFRCQKKGHLLKDCPDKKEGHQVRAIEVVPMALPMDSQSKIEEVKD